MTISDAVQYLLEANGHQALIPYYESGDAEVEFNDEYIEFNLQLILMRKSDEGENAATPQSQPGGDSP